LNVRHLNDGALRRVHDDRFAVSNREREHLDGCDRCGRRAQRVAADAAHAAQLLAGPLAATTATEAALGRLRESVVSGAADGGRVLRTPPRVVARRWAIGVIAVPVVAAGFVVSARSGRSAAVIPAGLNGTSVTVTGGPAMVAVYGGGSATSGEQVAANPPSLVIAEGVRPTASTNGATLQQLEDFLVAQPDVSPQLAAEIRAIGDPASTLPIPVITGLMTSQTISIDGVQGVVTGDSTGLGSAVIWEKDGVVYAVGGLLSQNEVVDIARSLH